MVGASAGMPEVRARLADRGQASADRQLAGDEVGSAGGTGRLRIVVGEQHALGGEAVEVRRVRAHQAAVVGADVRPADIVAHDEQDVRLGPAQRKARAARAWQGPAAPGRTARAARRQLVRAAPPSSMRRREVRLAMALLSPLMSGKVAADAAEADVAHAGVHHLRVARRRAVAPAVGRRAEERAALHHLPRDADGGLGGIEGGLHRRAARAAPGSSSRAWPGRCCAWPAAHQSAVHSQTFPHTSNRP